eukprot:gnl/Chilomastix_cuspidata/6750.p2 GENE.gnl/Chilomastix_cuspidata/6750~~gnl/Chilomastix_cuspidata/6750.p2  ORF type:complete len:119 (-),score=12.93 gnl/Chilomastix_cuspidata/6750:3797-4153(-)
MVILWSFFVNLLRFIKCVFAEKKNENLLVFFLITLLMDFKILKWEQVRKIQKYHLKKRLIFQNKLFAGRQAIPQNLQVKHLFFYRHFFLANPLVHHHFVPINGPLFNRHHGFFVQCLK